MGVVIQSLPKLDPARWARVHLEGDQERPFLRRTGYSLPFWRPEWEVRAAAKTH
jgi:hypothetical protein